MDKLEDSDYINQNFGSFSISIKILDLTKISF